MKIFIENTAVETLMNIYLAGHQRIPEQAEKKLLEYYQANLEARYQDFCKLIELAYCPHMETCFGRLREFVIYSINDVGQELFITVEDVYRLFSTTFQWRYLKENLINEYHMILNIPKWFMANMILPAVLKVENGKYIAEYSFEDRIVNIKNVFLPPGSACDVNSQCAVFMSCVVTPLDRASFNMINRHLEEIAAFRIFRRDVENIDFSNFQRFGNYESLAKSRFHSFAETHA
ncbi:MAG: hypothetical protein LWY06_08225 [Firmicutes bacterium]|nr:hypothetical protein [Bacillota bacterium]